MKATQNCRRLVLVSTLGALVVMVMAIAARGWQARKPEDGSHRYTNRLIHETSPYLLMHAHNPVDWYPWGPEAFEKAKKEGKPIFLSIGYSSCHWCHVMERESFEDEAIARLLNDHFVAIKVDREQRPDLDEIYMTAVQMMTGSGGWPMTTILTPDGKPFFGGTYFPRDQLAELLEKVSAAWADPAERTKLDKLADRVAAGIGRSTLGTAVRGELSPALTRNAVQSYLADLDPRNGGFGRAPKFPPAMPLMLMLAEQRRHPDPKLLHAVTLTLDHMARGGLYDQVGGGFHRYSTDERWLVPHFEKMLYDNALLAKVYLEAYATTHDSYYRRIGTETLDFALRELHDPKGGFWGTLDADSGGGEGRFYLWTAEQVIAVLGKADGALFNRVFDIRPEGNFEGNSIPNLLAKPVAGGYPPKVGGARELHTTPAVLWARLDRMRAKLRAAREKRPRPPVDDKVLANWNGLMLSALAKGYQITGEERYRQAAAQEASFLLGTMRRGGQLIHSYRQGGAESQVFLDDYSNLIVGLLDLHEATGEPRWLTEAGSLAKRMVADFWDEADGTFFTTPSSALASTGVVPLLSRLKRAEDNATPSGTSSAALALVRLSRLAGDADFRLKARRVLERHAGTMKRSPQALPQMLLAAAGLFTPGDAAATTATKRGPVVVTLVDVPSGYPRSGWMRAGQVFTVGVRLAIQRGWHINAAKPNAGAGGYPRSGWTRFGRGSGQRRGPGPGQRGPGPAPGALIATRAEPVPGPFRLLTATYPAAQTVRLGFSREPLQVYTGDTTIRLRLKALPGAEKASTLRLRVRYQACSDKACLLPVETLLTAATVTGGASSGVVPAR